VDGLCKRVVVYQDGCKKCKAGNVQFLFLFNDRFAGHVCQQGIASPQPLSKREGTGRLKRKFEKHNKD